MAVQELPKGYRYTALEVIKGIDLTGKLAIVTGGSSGIGVETVRALASAGATVLVLVRDLEKSKSIVEDIIKSTGNNKVELLKCDLASLKSLKEAAAALKQRDQPINILLLNAGIMAIPQREVTEDGFEVNFGVNFLANAFLLSELTPLLLRGAPSRAIAVSSCAHLRNDVFWDDIQLNNNYTKFGAYASSKSAIIHFMNEFNRRYHEKGVYGLSLHPGGIMTGLQAHMGEEEKKQLGWIDKDGNINPLFKTTEQGASTSVWAATSSELNGKGGIYLEDCSISVPAPEGAFMAGHGAHIYKEENEKRIWQVAEELLGKKL